MPAIHDNLNRLAQAFSVRDIMVHASDLVCTTVESDALILSKSYPDFTVIPIKPQDRIMSYYLRDSGEIQALGVGDLISDGTRLLDLLEIFEQRQFAFVLGPRKIDGYVHYSDLNHHLVKLAFYVLLQAVERFALDAVRSRLTDDYLKAVLGISRFEQVRKMYERSGDAGQSVINYLNVADILKLGKRAGAVQVDDSMIQKIKWARDGAAHALENLVAEHADIERLAEVKRHCSKMLGTV